MIDNCSRRFVCRAGNPISLRQLSIINCQSSMVIYQSFRWNRRSASAKGIVVHPSSATTATTVPVCPPKNR